MNDVQQIAALVAEKQESAIALADAVWQYAEPNWREAKSAAALADALEQEGFAVERAACGMETAFVAEWGTGGPVIAFLGEYDALPGLSQQAGCVQKKPLCAGAPGHGCGHNLLGAGSFAAAAALKEYFARGGIRATVRYYGCPAEEDGGGKVFFARAGRFDDVAAVFAWHPAAATYVAGQGCLAVTGVLYRFSGRTAHAAAAPFAGRSALDAAELMNVGCNYLREHIIPEARLHYAYRDTGGMAPNVVPASACVHYYIRAPKVAQMLAIKKRVDDVARGAALMTGTSLAIQEVDGFSDYVPNQTLSQLLCDCMRESGAPAWDAADRALAARFAATIPPEERQANLAAVLAATGLPAEHYAGRDLDDGVAPLHYAPQTAEPGSTDVGDVSYCAPTAQCDFAAQALGTGGHTWQMTAQSASALGHKGMLAAARALALAGARAAADPALLARAKEEHRRSCPDGYFCPMPAGAAPGGGQETV